MPTTTIDGDLPALHPKPIISYEWLTLYMSKLTVSVNCKLAGTWFGISFRNP